MRRADVVTLDEFGCIPLDVDGARLLFRVISDGYEARSLILTTNTEFSQWATIFADEKLAAASVDRIVHHGRPVEFNGPSRRMDASPILGKGGARNEVIVLGHVGVLLRGWFQDYSCDATPGSIPEDELCDLLLLEKSITAKGKEAPTQDQKDSERG